MSTSRTVPRLLTRLVSVSTVATCWLVVLTAQLPAQQAPDPVRAAFRALGASHVQAVRFAGFGATYVAGPDGSSDGGTRVPLRGYVAQVDYRASIVHIQPSSAAKRLDGIWATPHGFLKAAMASGATTRTVALGTEVSFSTEGRRYVGILNEQHQVDRVRTWVGDPTRGDGLVETYYRDYQRHGAVMFPRHITQQQDGLPSLDLWVSTVDVNRTDAPVPATGR